MYLGSNPEPIDEQKRIMSMLKRENRTMNIKFFDAASKIAGVIFRFIIFIYSYSCISCNRRCI